MTDVNTRIISGSGVYQGRATTYVTQLGKRSLTKDPVINEGPGVTISGYLGETTNGRLDTRLDDKSYYTA